MDQRSVVILSAGLLAWGRNLLGADPSAAPRDTPGVQGRLGHSTGGRTMRATKRCRQLLTVVALTVVAASGWPCLGRALGEEASRGAVLSREEAIKHTLAGIDKELADHGGSFEKWGESLKSYRAAIKGLSAGKWPWPAKKDFQFQGKEVALAMLDTFEGLPLGNLPLQTILGMDRKLKEQGVDLIFVPLPDKLAIYPDYFSDTAPAHRMVTPAIQHLMKKLLESDVEVVDLFPAFYAARAQNEDRPLYYATDSHWRNVGAQLAAEHIAQRLRRYDFAQKALADGNRYSVTPERRQHDRPDDLLVVLDSKTGGRYADSRDSPILIVGESNLMMNMGAVAGHMPAHIGRHVGMPLDFGPNKTPSDYYGKLSGKRVVVWATISRVLVQVGQPQAGKAGAKK